MNLNPILIAQIVNLSNEINIKQSQLNYLIFQAFTKAPHASSYDPNDFNSSRFPFPHQNMPFPPPPNGFPVDPSHFHGHYTFGGQTQRPPQQNQWGMSPFGQMAKEHNFVPPAFRPQEPAPQREPVDVEQFDILLPLREMILSKSFNSSFMMKGDGLERAKNAGVLELKNKDHSDEFIYIRVRGSYDQPTIQVVILDTDWNLIKSYKYSFTGVVDDGVEDEWVLTKHIEDYRVSARQIQKDFFKGYPSLMQPLPTED